MRNSSWKGWFGAEVGFSIYIHRRGFTSSSTINHQSVLPASQGMRARRTWRARAPYACAPWEVAPTRWATPPYRGHKAKFAPCETPPGWIGLVLKLDSLYIYIGGVSHHHPPSIIICSPARTSARKRTTPRERNWSPAPPRRASGQLPHGRTSQPTRQECSDHSSLGVLCFLFTLMRSTKRHARRVLASHRREETAAPTHGTAFGSCRTPSVWGRVEG